MASASEFARREVDTTEQAVRTLWHAFESYGTPPRFCFNQKKARFLPAAPLSFLQVGATSARPWYCETHFGLCAKGGCGFYTPGISGL